MERVLHPGGRDGGRDLLRARGSAARDRRRAVRTAPGRARDPSGGRVPVLAARSRRAARTATPDRELVLARALALHRRARTGRPLVGVRAARGAARPLRQPDADPARRRGAGRAVREAGEGRPGLGARVAADDVLSDGAPCDARRSAGDRPLLPRARSRCRGSQRFRVSVGARTAHGRPPGGARTRDRLIRGSSGALSPAGPGGAPSGAGDGASRPSRTTPVRRGEPTT